MTMPNPLPYAVFSGSWGDRASGGWYPAQAVVRDGIITMWIATANGWAQHFSVPAGEVTVKSAAQRITLVVRGKSFPILADPAAAGRARTIIGADAVGHIADLPVVNVASTVGRGVNQGVAAQAFNSQGGGEFIAAARASGARVSRLGYGALIAIGCGGGLLVVLAVVVIAAVVLAL